MDRAVAKAGLGGKVPQLYVGSESGPRWIDDSQAMLRGLSGKLGDVLEHPEFFEVYPEAKNLMLRLDRTPGRMGEYDPRTGVIVLDMQELSPNGWQPEDILMHELQHYVQQKEGWPFGTHYADPQYAENPGERQAWETTQRRWNSHQTPPTVPPPGGRK